VQVDFWIAELLLSAGRLLDSRTAVECRSTFG
jgi:hypothetical protein